MTKYNILVQQPRPRAQVYTEGLRKPGMNQANNMFE